MGRQMTSSSPHKSCTVDSDVLPLAGPRVKMSRRTPGRLIMLAGLAVPGRMTSPLHLDTVHLAHVGALRVITGHQLRYAPHPAVRDRSRRRDHAEAVVPEDHEDQGTDMSSLRGNRQLCVAHLKGTSSLSRSTLSSRPYQGHITQICDEKEMKEMSRIVPTSLAVRAVLTAGALHSP